MEELFIETKTGKTPIDSDLVQKYHLQEGTYTPFSHEKIVDKDGNFVHPEPEKEEPSFEFKEDEVEEMENGLLLSTSEMIDIAEGADSYPDGNQDD